jgi:hypothetical protein
LAWDFWDEILCLTCVISSQGYSNCRSADEAKGDILREIGLLFNRRRALLVEMSRFETEINTLEATVPPTINIDTLLTHGQLPVTSAVSSAGQSPIVNHPTPGAVTSSGGATSGDIATAKEANAPARKRGSSSTPRRKTTTKGESNFIHPAGRAHIPRRLYQRDIYE